MTQKQSHNVAPVEMATDRVYLLSRRLLTFYTAAARLQHPGVHVGLGVGEELVSGQVGVVGRSDEIIAQRLLHVLIYLMVQRVKNVTRRAAHETCKT